MPIANKKIRNLLIGANIWYLAEGMFGPLFAIFSERVGGDILDVTWAWSAYLIVTGVLTIVVGNITNKKFSKERTMVLGYALNALCTFGYLFISTPFHLLLVQVGLGIASALATPTWDALYDQHSPKQYNGRLWGLASGNEQIITGLAILAGGFIVVRFSFTTLFLIMGILQVFATIYQAQILRKR